MEQPLDNQGHHQVALPGALAPDHAIETELAKPTKNSSDVTMRQGAFDYERFAHGHQLLVAEEPAESLDLALRPMAEIGKSAFAGLLAFAPGLAKEDRGW